MWALAQQSFYPRKGVAGGDRRGGWRVKTAGGTAKLKLLLGPAKNFGGKVTFEEQTRFPNILPLERPRFDPSAFISGCVCIKQDLEAGV